MLVLTKWWVASFLSIINCSHHVGGKKISMCEAVVKVISISSLIFALPQALRSIKWSINLFKCLGILASACFLFATLTDLSFPLLTNLAGSAHRRPNHLPKWPLHLMDIRSGSKSSVRFWSTTTRWFLEWGMCHLRSTVGNKVWDCSFQPVLIKGKMIWGGH